MITKKIRFLEVRGLKKIFLSYEFELYTQWITYKFIIPKIVSLGHIRVVLLIFVVSFSYDFQFWYDILSTFHQTKPQSLKITKFIPKLTSISCFSSDLFLFVITDRLFYILIDGLGVCEWCMYPFIMDLSYFEEATDVDFAYFWTPLCRFTYDWIIKELFWTRYKGLLSILFRIDKRFELRNAIAGILHRLFRLNFALLITNSLVKLLFK